MHLVRCRTYLVAGLRFPITRAAYGFFLSRTPETSRRLYFTPSCICRTEKRAVHETDSIEAVAADANSAADASDPLASIGRRLYSLKQYHIKALNSLNANYESYQYVTHEAWNLLQSISDEEVDRLSTRDLAEIVHAYQYFSNYWENGVEGPSKTSSSGGGRASKGFNDNADGAPYKASFDYPLVERHASDDASGAEGLDDEVIPASRANQLQAPPKRANPLDEILDF